MQGWLREVWQGPGRSEEVQGSLELQNGGLRALEGRRPNIVYYKDTETRLCVLKGLFIINLTNFN